MVNDLRYAFRLLRRRPGFTIGTGATIALAVGGSVAIFSVVYGLLFRPMVVPDADRLVVARSQDARFPGVSSPVSFPQFQDWEVSAPALERVAAVGDIRFDVTGESGAERLAGQAVSSNFFETLRAPPAFGRTFTSTDAGSSPCVISHRLWQGRFGGDPVSTRRWRGFTGPDRIR
jgi:putative ABC transport system permease protein